MTNIHQLSQTAILYRSQVCWISTRLLATVPMQRDLQGLWESNNHIIKLCLLNRRVMRGAPLMEEALKIFGELLSKPKFNHLTAITIKRLTHKRRSQAHSLHHPRLPMMMSNAIGGVLAAEAPLRATQGDILRGKKIVSYKTIIRETRHSANHPRTQTALIEREKALEILHLLTQVDHQLQRKSSIQLWVTWNSYRMRTTAAQMMEQPREIIYAHRSRWTHLKFNCFRKIFP